MLIPFPELYSIGCIIYIIAWLSQQISVCLMQTTFSSGDIPSLLQLLKFPGKEKTFSIPERIGTNYSDFGIFLLNDKTGADVDSIVKEKRENAKDINMAILKRWLQGQGRLPVTWKTLIEVLQDTGLTVLASDIESK